MDTIEDEDYEEQDEQYKNVNLMNLEGNWKTLKLEKDMQNIFSQRRERGLVGELWIQICDVQTANSSNDIYTLEFLGI